MQFLRLILMAQNLKFEDWLFDFIRIVSMVFSLSASFLLSDMNKYRIWAYFYRY